MRYIVAELLRHDEDADLVYLRENDDYKMAKSLGFDGEYPGFPADRDHQKVLSAFMRRLPPRQRNDFNQFLEAIRIRPGTSISDFALLGYAGAKLPGDDFCIIHPFDQADPPFELLLLISGYRYYQVTVPYEAIKPGMIARFECQPKNMQDPQAIRIVIPEVSPETAGYVCRGLLPQFHIWIKSAYMIEARVERLNGTTEHPLVYLYVAIKK
jgi:hypothetical protein